MLGLGLGGLALALRPNSAALALEVWGLGLGMWGLGLACQRLVNNVLPLKLSSRISHDAFDCVNKVQVVDCVLCELLGRSNNFQVLLKLGFMLSFANLRPWFYPLKCEALALKTSGLGLVLAGPGLEDLWPWPCIAWPWPWHCWPC